MGDGNLNNRSQTTNNPRVVPVGWSRKPPKCSAHVRHKYWYEAAVLPLLCSILLSARSRACKMLCSGTHGSVSPSATIGLSRVNQLRYPKCSLPKSGSMPEKFARHIVLGILGRVSARAFRNPRATANGVRKESHGEPRQHSKD